MDCYCNSKSLYEYNKDYEKDILVDQDGNIVDGSIKKEKSLWDRLNIQQQEKYLQLDKSMNDLQISRIQYSEIEKKKIDFKKEFVDLNKPVIIEGGLDRCAGLKKWCKEYIGEMLQDRRISVEVNLDGWADSVYGQYLVEPCSVEMSWQQFVDHREQASEVAYIQKQDDNFNKEFGILNKDIDQLLIKQFETLFQNPVDAFNLWIGTDRSITSSHQDFYENIYMQFQGEKHFTLLSPLSFLHLNSNIVYPAKLTKSQSQSHSHFYLQTQKVTTTPWISVNPDSISFQQSLPKSNVFRQYHIILKKGDILYLPSLWYHQVAQHHPLNDFIIATNMWFDMDFSQTHYQIHQDIQSLSYSLFQTQ